MGDEGPPEEGPSLETSIFPLSFQVVREPLPFAYIVYNTGFQRAVHLTKFPNIHNNLQYHSIH